MRVLLTKLSRWIGRREATASPARRDARIESTDKEAEAYALKLEECAAAWKKEPGLMLDVSGAGIAAIVWCREAKPDQLGFHLTIEVEETLVAPEGLRKGDTVVLGGNWKFGWFNTESVTVPECFSIYFGEQGVERVRQFWAALPPGKIRRPVPRPFFGMLRQCFLTGRRGGISEEEFQKRLKMFGRKGSES